jgi:acyl-CoA thioesterase
VDARTWLGLEPTDDPARWRLPVVPGLCTGGNFLFGGSALAAAIAAMEATSERPVVWATAQYLSYARPPAVMDIDVRLAVHGHQITQARAICHVDDQEILTVNAALGVRPMEATGEWAVRPEAPPPEECPIRVHRRFHEPGETIMSRLEQRVVGGRDLDDLDGTPGSGRSLMWVRVPDLIEMSGPALAVLGDYVPSGISQALGLPAGGNSLDNTLRVARLVPTEWVLLDIRIHAIANGFAHGLVHEWAEDGTLLATASQSAIVRFWKD